MYELIPYESKSHLEDLIRNFVSAFVDLRCHMCAWCYKDLMEEAINQEINKLFMGSTDTTFFLPALDLSLCSGPPFHPGNINVLLVATSQRVKYLLSRTFMNRHFLAIDVLPRSSEDVYGRRLDDLPIAGRVLSKHEWKRYQLAVAMCTHERLGKDSILSVIEPGLLRAILHLCVYHKADIALY
jgi:hypothetical protein